ncbi:Coproporphyrinogen III oxidase [Cantharellus anzutake]|uniref:Coproporphyrinogen III oxidase n=1 Tax=Cantharellus anzutake TaxID=1750568 RepID=UPI001903C850|nr:Coproporphyrinogen III oxidase [Cantharellus anzutake]KAF8344219.1 Coproporphyrinogen III oxidase [Cantharellus anzutake]
MCIHVTYTFFNKDLPMRNRMKAYIIHLQNRIIEAFESLDPNAPFKRDKWNRKEGGLGISATVCAGKVLEKAGVNISVVYGKLPPPAIKQMRADHSEIPYDPESGKSLPFFAAGISLVIHPQHPLAPTVHANYRYFEISDDVPHNEVDGSQTESSDESIPEGGKILAWWFGGGSDLTPTYLLEEDAKHFHNTLKSACDTHGSSIYPTFKKWCDEYFYIPHRKESRGVGGIFFDDLSTAHHKRLDGDGASSVEKSDRPKTADDIFAFVRSCGDAFLPSYIPILKLRSSPPFDPSSPFMTPPPDHYPLNEPLPIPYTLPTSRLRRWQLLRRGRYVEFNLIYDRGTKFGLQTPGARIESILMSLPETARWEYMNELEYGEDGKGVDGTEESKILEVLRVPKEWV